MPEMDFANGKNIPTAAPTSYGGFNNIFID